MHKFTVFALLLLPAAAQKPPAEVRWSGLSGVALGRKVRVAPAGGTAVEGKVLAVEPEALQLATTRIPRASIATLEVQRMRKRGRIIGVSAGFVLGVAAGLAVAITTGWGDLFGPPQPHVGAAVAAVGLVAGCPVAVYFLGRRWDRHYVRITILPDPSPPASPGP